MSLRFGVLGLALVLVACSGSAASDDGAGKPAVAPSDGENEPEVVFHTTGGDIVFTVEIADSPSERQQGLMNRKTLAADRGMIFIFPADEVQRFWMKNTLIPLDMIFVNSGLEVVGVVADAEPLTLTERTVGVPSAYVVEVNGGFAAKNGIATGVHMSLQNISSALPKF